MQLSPHFTLAEFEHSDTAAKHNIPNHMQAYQIENAKALCANVLEVVRAFYGKAIDPTSAYRCNALNILVGGQKNSQHKEGEAMDFHVAGVSDKQVFEDISSGKIKLDYDQCILERDSKGRTWVHISHRRNGKNRKQYFSLVKR